MMYKEQILLDRVTATTVSEPFNVEGYNKIGIQLIRANHSAGSSTFTFHGTVDGQTWTALNVLVTNVANTNGQTLTRVASVALSSDSSAIVWLQDMALKAIRVTVTEATDGTHSAYAIATA